MQIAIRNPEAGLGVVLGAEDSEERPNLSTAPVTIPLLYTRLRGAVYTDQ